VHKYVANQIDVELIHQIYRVRQEGGQDDVGELSSFEGLQNVLGIQAIALFQYYIICKESLVYEPCYDFVDRDKL